VQQYISATEGKQCREILKKKGEVKYMIVLSHHCWFGAK
jgi:hypothetical protein